MLQQNIKESKNDFNIELILINDSPDEVISDEDILHAEDFKIILLLNAKNRGIHYSRVRGLGHATGEYIMFLDQDDKIENTYFSSQLKHLQNADVVVANGIAQYPDYEKLLYRYWIMQWTVRHIWFYAKFDCRIISPGQCLIKKESIPSAWKENILENNGADDYFLWLAMLSDKKRFVINRECVYQHVYTSNNASLDCSQMRLSVLEMIKKTDNHIDSSMVSIIKKRIDHKRKSFLVRVVENINKNIGVSN